MSAYAWREISAIFYLQIAHHVAAKTENALCASDQHQRHFAFLPRFKAHGGTGRNIEAIAFCGFAIKFQRGIDLVKMVMGPHLDRSVAMILDDRSLGFTPDRKSVV